MNAAEWQAIHLTLTVSVISTAILLILCIPLAWKLSRTSASWKPFVEAITALPLIMPPTVLGFYLLLAFGPSGPIGKLTAWLDIPSLSFSFQGLIVASLIYSLPFVLQPLITTFNMVQQADIEAATLLGATYWQRLRKIILPSCRAGILVASSLGFAHTIGEFGVVLMIGGNIEGETRVVSIALYNYVEQADYTSANRLGLLLLAFSFVTLVFVYWLNLLQKRRFQTTR